MANIHRYLLSATMLASCGETETTDDAIDEDAVFEEIVDQLPNNFPILNGAGTGATYSSEGFVDLDNAFATAPAGGNGRTCSTCHAVESGWTINPWQIETLFWLTDGTHPIFNPLDANNPNANVSTKFARQQAYSNMISRGVFRRGGAVVANAEFEVLSVDDPNGFADTTRFVFFRRPLSTANMYLITGVLWDDRLTVSGDGTPPRQGLFNQARGTVTGAMQAPPATEATLNAMVDDELQLATAQLAIHGLGRLDSCGARGGPQNLASQTLVAGRWDLFDAWINLVPGSCTTRAADRKRAQIARGQELFNEKQSATGGRCRGCHNVINNGTNLNGTLFDIHVSSAANRPPNTPLYTLRNRTTGETKQITDPGKAFVSGRWNDLGRFKAPSLRGLAARAPYFHNGMAGTLRAVVHHYEDELGFNFTADEEDDLVAFLEAL